MSEVNFQKKIAEFVLFSTISTSIMTARRRIFCNLACDLMEPFLKPFVDAKNVEP